MKRWLRRILIAAAVATLTLGILYECATHVGRGWLFGEAFYDGRPTSYWRWRIDRWAAGFESAEAAESSMKQFRIKANDGTSVNVIIMCLHPIAQPVDLAEPAPDTEVLMWIDGGAVVRAPTTWERVRSALGLDSHEDRGSPGVFNGGDDAEPVLRELETDGCYRLFIERARRNALVAQRHHVFVAK